MQTLAVMAGMGGKRVLKTHRCCRRVLQMQTLELDGKNWRAESDFYDAWPLLWGASRTTVVMLTPSKRP